MASWIRFYSFIPFIIEFLFYGRIFEQQQQNAYANV